MKLSPMVLISRSLCRPSSFWPWVKWTLRISFIRSFADLVTQRSWSDDIGENDRERHALAASPINEALGVCLAARRENKFIEIAPAVGGLVHYLDLRRESLGQFSFGSATETFSLQGLSKSFRRLLRRIFT
jgi:hypothetical protein